MEHEFLLGFLRQSYDVRLSWILIKFNSFHAKGLYIGFWTIPGYCEYFSFDGLSDNFQDL